MDVQRVLEFVPELLTNLDKEHKHDEGEHGDDDGGGRDGEVSARHGRGARRCAGARASGVVHATPFPGLGAPMSVLCRA